MVFTYKPRRRGDPDHFEAVRRALRAKGLNPDEVVKTGELGATGKSLEKLKLQGLTFGQETSLNGFEYCDVVILAGVLHRSKVDLAAALRAQAGRLDLPTPEALLEDAVQSEIAALVYQAFSRGSCRRMEAGGAAAMLGYVVHRDPSLQARVGLAMPGVVWEVRDPVHLKKANAVGVTKDTASSLADFLSSLPPEVDSISSMKAKKALGIGSSDAQSQAFTRAGDQLQEHTRRWEKRGRGFVRVTEQPTTVRKVGGVG